MLVLFVIGLFVSFVHSQACANESVRCPGDLLCDGLTQQCLDFGACTVNGANDCPPLPESPFDRCQMGVCTGTAPASQCVKKSCEEMNLICASPALGCVPVCINTGDCPSPAFCTNITNDTTFCGNIPCHGGKGFCGTAPCATNAECPIHPYPQNLCLLGYCNEGKCDVHGCDFTDTPLDICLNADQGCRTVCETNFDCSFNNSLYCLHLTESLSVCDPITCSNGNSTQCPSLPYAPDDNCTQSICDLDNRCKAVNCEYFQKTCIQGVCIDSTPAPTSQLPCQEDTQCARYPNASDLCALGYCNKTSGLCDTHGCAVANTPEDVCISPSRGCATECSTNERCSFNNSFFCVDLGDSLSVCQPILCSNGDHTQCPSLPYAPINNCTQSICDVDNRCKAVPCELLNRTCTLGVCISPTASPTEAPTRRTRQPSRAPTRIVGAPPPVIRCRNNSQCIRLSQDFYCVRGSCATVPCANASDCDAYRFPFEPNRCATSSCGDGFCFFETCDQQNLACASPSQGCVSISNNDTTLGGVAFGFFIFFILFGCILWCIAWYTRKRNRQKGKVSDYDVI